MTYEQRKSVEQFLEVLQLTSGGRVIVANMNDSHLEGLISTERLREFLLDCAEAYSSNGGATPTMIVEDVARGWGPRRSHYLRESRQTESVPGEQLSTTMKTETFWQFVLNPSYKDPTRVPVVLPPTPTNSPSGLREYATRLQQIASSSDWIAPDATLGRPLPEPANCWITSDRFAPDPDAHAYSESGTHARDELGLIDCRDDACLLRFRFSADAVARSGDPEMARPSFADLGNSRFAAQQMSKRARTYAAAGWGAAVHLGKLSSGSPGITGASERVTKSLRAASLGLAADFLGAVVDRGRTAATDDDDAFANRVHRGRTPVDIRNGLMSVLE